MARLRHIAALENDAWLVLVGLDISERIDAVDIPLDDIPRVSAPFKPRKAEPATLALQVLRVPL